MISRITKVAFIACLAFSLADTVSAAQAVSMDELLQQVKAGTSQGCRREQGSHRRISA